MTLDGIYRPINSRIIEGLKYRCNEDDIIRNMDQVISGDRIKIERGPFAEFICTVEEIEEERRAWVLIDVLQRQTRAEVSLDDL